MYCCPINIKENEILNIDHSHQTILPLHPLLLPTPPPLGGCANRRDILAAISSRGSIALGWTSVVVTIADVCAVSGGLVASLAVGRLLWVDLPSGRWQGIRERVGQGEGTERRGPAEHGKGAQHLGPARWGNDGRLADARPRPTRFGSRFSCQELISKECPRRPAHMGTLSAVAGERVDLVTKHTRLSICEADAWCGSVDLGADMDIILRRSRGARAPDWRSCVHGEEDVRAAVDMPQREGARKYY